ncbi:MAG: TPM domain-containing protein [Gordonia sp. (in: high G+C Gram-positive bacteria)]|uniref:TPM domain-containing protein n=1 Tax=Gordonia sp. (in: high G+C Gram-positive bacteria) TaxID=84139 RepID=UPI0039E21EF7
MTSARRSRSLLVSLTLLFALVFGAGPASANPPTHMPDPLVDSAGVLTTGQEDAINDQIDQLANDRDLNLWVIYVRSFEGKSPKDWGTQTQSLTSLGYHDILLAIATDDKQYYLGTAEPIDSVSQKDLDAIGADRVEPAVKTGRWSDAALGTVEALRSGGKGVRIALIVAGIAALLAAAGALAYFLRRRSDDEDAESGDGSNGDALTLGELSEQTVDTLDPWSQDVLTNTDNALSTSSDELALAEDEVGADAVIPFRSALQTADGELASAFRLRRQVDTDTSLDDQQKHDLLVEIITLCSDADAGLDDRSADFDALRDLSDDAPGRLDRLAERSAQVAGRFDAARAGADAVSDGEETVASAVAGNVDLADELTQFADDAIEQGRDTLAESSDASAAAAIRSAEGALDAATRLLDAIDEARTAGDGGEVDAAGRLTLAESYLETRRGAVGASARTLLSEAARLLDAGEDGAGPLADEALDQARADVETWQASAPAEDAAPVLAGVLVDVILRSSGPGDAPIGAGGYSAGGRSPGSFGGPDTAGRIGTGERR